MDNGCWTSRRVTGLEDSTITVPVMTAQRGPDQFSKYPGFFGKTVQTEWSGGGGGDGGSTPYTPNPD